MRRWQWFHIFRILPCYPFIVERIDQIRQKLKRAKHHILDLDSQFAVFLKDAYSINPKSKPKISQVQFCVDNAKPIPPDFSLVIGDALHNLRSALDHLVWHLVESAGNCPDDKTYFPIYEHLVKSPKKDTAQEIARKIKGVPPGCEKLFHDMQPDVTKDFTLWHLHRLDIADKHRLLITVNCVFETWGVDGVWFGPMGLRFNVEVGDSLLNIPIDTYEKNKDKIKFGFDIAFGDSEIVAGKSVLVTLNGMADLVDRIICDFAPFLI
jgi:hypothetical protein